MDITKTIVSAHSIIKTYSALLEISAQISSQCNHLHCQFTPKALCVWGRNQEKHHGNFLITLFLGNSILKKLFVPFERLDELAISQSFLKTRFSSMSSILMLSVATKQLLFVSLPHSVLTFNNIFLVILSSLLFNWYNLYRRV